MKRIEEWHVGHGKREGFFLRLYSFHPGWYRLEGALTRLCDVIMRLPLMNRVNVCRIHGWADDKVFATEQVVVEVPMTHEDGMVYARAHPEHWGWLLEEER